MALYEILINNTDSTSSFANIIYNFNTAMDGYLIFSILLALMLILTGGLYSVTNDFIDALAQSSYVLTVLSLILFSINLAGNKLLSWEQFSFFLALTGLIIGYKKLTD